MPISRATATSIPYSEIRVGGVPHRYVDLAKIFPQPLLASLPRSVKVLCENVVRCSPEFVPALLAWARDRSSRVEMPFYPARVLMHDTTCSPALADIAGMRDAVAERGGDPGAVNPAIPVDLVIDHSVSVDEYGHAGALAANLRKDFARNSERYRFIKWAQQALDNFRVVPPGNGILHQVNLEYLAQVVRIAEGEPSALLVPDTLLGTDSHTPMINALGVVGWGVGGIEGQAAMLGEPVSVILPVVVGVRLTGALRPGVTATDLVLHLTRRFRDHGVVDKFIEFYGPGVAALTVGDRATVSNMAPEYGSTCSYFPIDRETLSYLRCTGRSARHVERVEAYARAQTLWLEEGGPDPQFDEHIAVDLSDIRATMSGPRLPHQQNALSEVPQSFEREFPPVHERRSKYQDGVVALAAITSCTNTSNPALLVSAGLLARNARRRGLTRRPWVKTSLSPGSKAASAYLAKAGLQDDLDALGFNVVGYGCMTCIGNSGALEPDIVQDVEEHGLRAVGVISGNRNFDGRVNSHLAGAYLASPALVVAAAIAGTILIDFSKDPLAVDPAGNPVWLKDIWPTQEELGQVLSRSLAVFQFEECYAGIWNGTPAWQALEAPGSPRFPWDPASNYIRRPPYVDPVDRTAGNALTGLRPLLLLGDNVTTDHISPAGAIPKDSIAGRYLQGRGVAVQDFNVYASRRTNHEVMMRGAFSNPKLVNGVVPRDAGIQSGCLAWDSTHRALLPPYEAALTYGEHRKLIVLAGRNYGAGSSRDWAAKAPALLGVAAVIAESYERIHRSNLIGMGIYPLEFCADTAARDLCHDGTEILDVALGEPKVGRTEVAVTVRRAGRSEERHHVICRIDTEAELEYLKYRGVLRAIVDKVLRRTVSNS
ncbi:MAG: aconitate hydratase AcnA [Rhodospirillaceae bacterium]